MRKLGTVYAGCRERIADLVLPLGEDAKTITVPACPEWSVYDLVAHVVGSADDVVAGRLTGAPGEAWTATQVEKRRSRTIADLIEEWETLAPAMQEIIDAENRTGPLHFKTEEAATSDALSHEHDIRGALDKPGARDSDALPVGLLFYATNRIDMAAQDGVSLRIKVIGGEDFGSPDAAVTLTGEPYELLRALAGRRTPDQLRRMDWTGDVERVIPRFERTGALQPPAEPLKGE